MNFEGDAIKHGEFDISELIDRIAGFAEDRWCEDTSRQEKFEAHTDTQTIKLLFDPDYRHTNPTEHPALQEFASLIEPLHSHIVATFGKTMRQRKLIRKNGPGYFIRIVLTRLAANSEITRHVDDGESLKLCHRIHVPIITNEECFFCVGESRIHMRAGEMWEINNRLVHYVENGGDQARVHLIQDFVQPGENVFDHDGPMIA